MSCTRTRVQGRCLLTQGLERELSCDLAPLRMDSFVFLCLQLERDKRCFSIEVSLSKTPHLTGGYSRQRCQPNIAHLKKKKRKEEETDKLITFMSRISLTSVFLCLFIHVLLIKEYVLLLGGGSVLH